MNRFFCRRVLAGQEQERSLRLVREGSDLGAAPAKQAEARMLTTKLSLFVHVTTYCRSAGTSRHVDVKRAPAVRAARGTLAEGRQFGCQALRRTAGCDGCLAAVSHFAQFEELVLAAWACEKDDLAWRSLVSRCARRRGWSVCDARSKATICYGD